MRTLKSLLVNAAVFSLGIGVVILFSPGTQIPEAQGAAKAEIVLYTQPNFQGQELRLFGDAADLPFENMGDGSQVFWNDGIGSIIVVSGTWRLYQHGRMNTALDETPIAALDLSTKQLAAGWSAVVSATSGGPLRIASPEHFGIGPDISSVQLIAQSNLPDWVIGK